MAKANKKKKSKAPIIIILTIVVAAAGGVLLLKKQMENITKNLLLPTEYEVTTGNITRTVDGSGSLQAEETYEIKIPAGLRIQEMNVEVGDYIYAGDVVATIDPESVTTLIVTTDNEIDSITETLKSHSNDRTQYQTEEYESRKADLEELKEQLLVFYDDPVIRAESDGIVTEAQGSSAPSTSGMDYSSMISSVLGIAARPSALKGEASVQESGAPDEGSQDISAESGNTFDAAVITDFSSLNIEAPVRGAAPVTEVEENDYFTGTILWGVGTESFTGTSFEANTSYAAVIMLTPKPGYAFSNENVPQIEGAAQSVGTVEPNTGILTIIAAFPATEADPEEPSETEPAPVVPGLDVIPSDVDISTLIPEGTDASSIISNLIGEDSIQEYLQQYIAQQAASQMGGMDLSSLAGAAGGIDYSSITSGLASASAGSRPSGTISEDTIAKVARTETVKISINVDELDILSVSVGQEASITLDALEETFTGVISKVSNLSSSSGGNAKYTIDISIPMDENMRFGMTAMATINVSNADDVIVIPMEALQQRGDQLFVYGGYDPESGELNNEIEVITGITDGSNVEITSGLSAGDKVYYSTSNLMDMFGF